MNMNAIMKQAQQMQRQMQENERKLNEMKFTNSVAGAITVVVNGHSVVESIDIDEDALDKDNKEMLEEMIMTCINGAFADANKTKEDMMKGVTGGMSIPGMF